MEPVLNQKLYLEEQGTVPDGSGGFQPIWVSLGTLWGDIQTRAGRGAAIDEVAGARTGFRIIVRAAPVGAPSRPRPGQRFRNAQRIFRIQSVAEQDAQARYLRVLVEEEVAK